MEVNKIPQKTDKEIKELSKESLIKTIRKKKLSLNEVMTEENINRALEEYNLDSEDSLYYEIGIRKQNPTSVIKVLLNVKSDDNAIIDKLIKSNLNDDNKKGDISTALKLLQLHIFQERSF